MLTSKENTALEKFKSWLNDGLSTRSMLKNRKFSVLHKEKCNTRSAQFIPRKHETDFDRHKHSFQQMLNAIESQ